MKTETQLIHAKAGLQDPYNATTPPLYQTSTFGQSDASCSGPYDYSRSGNPTRQLLESQIAALEGAHQAFAFASGMAALTAVSRLLHAGDHVIAGDDLYGGTCRLLSTLLPRVGIAVDYVDTTDPRAIAASVRPETRMLLIETPTNPFQKINDLRQIAAVAQEAEALLVVDNTLMTPLLQNPLAFGADIVVHSGTKYLCGHSDVTAGVVAVASAALAEQIYFVQNAEGAALGPFDSWLLLRGLKTLSLRLERQQANAQQIAEFLQRHPKVEQVFFAGLDGHPGAAIHRSQASGAGALLTFSVPSEELAGFLVRQTQLFHTSVSFGSVTSLISTPASMSHASIPGSLDAKAQIPKGIIRLSVGIEAIEDLLDDLRRAFDAWDSEADGRGEPRGPVWSLGEIDATAAVEPALQPLG